MHVVTSVLRKAGVERGLGSRKGTAERSRGGRGVFT